LVLTAGAADDPICAFSLDIHPGDGEKARDMLFWVMDCNCQMPVGEMFIRQIQSDIRMVVIGKNCGMDNRFVACIQRCPEEGAHDVMAYFVIVRNVSDSPDEGPQLITGRRVAGSIGRKNPRPENVIFYIGNGPFRGKDPDRLDIGFIERLEA